ncbi:hypothetical protein PR048_007753 [Dryococelus australis]|uniref:Uncharacterized protein n=1 Tax=Dryococelus australis TaxID=614101 RepID=A0ABQ9HV75_9NEOP|nr:hypothetical protein PR048_007753 [Dryococelus australis]
MTGGIPSYRRGQLWEKEGGAYECEGRGCSLDYWIKCVLRADVGEVRRIWSSAGMKGREKLEIPEETRRSVASSGTIPKCENLLQSASLLLRVLRLPSTWELYFSVRGRETRERYKGDTATRIKCATATKRKALNWRAVFSSHFVCPWDFQLSPYSFIGGKSVESVFTEYTRKRCVVPLVKFSTLGQALFARAGGEYPASTTSEELEVTVAGAIVESAREVRTRESSHTSLKGRHRNQLQHVVECFGVTRAANCWQTALCPRLFASPPAGGRPSRARYEGRGGLPLPECLFLSRPEWEDLSRLRAARARCLLLQAVHGKNGEVLECKGERKREILEKIRRPAASSGTIPTCESPGVSRPGTESLVSLLDRSPLLFCATTPPSDGSSLGSASSARVTKGGGGPLPASYIYMWCLVNYLAACLLECLRMRDGCVHYTVLVRC